jgi:hypothetical protein
LASLSPAVGQGGACSSVAGGGTVSVEGGATAFGSLGLVVAQGLQDEQRRVAGAHLQHTPRLVETHEGVPVTVAAHWGITVP